MTTTRAVGSLLGTLVGLGLGCTSVRPNPNHCAHAQGDQTCADRYPAERAFCTRCGRTPGKDGCVAERPADDACYSPCGGGLSLLDDASCQGSEGSTSESDASTGASGSSESGGSSSEGSSTTGPMPCESDEECTEAEAPFCGVSGECGTCSGTRDPDAACAGVDPLQPLCVGDACVACTPEDPLVCDEQLLLCDGTTNACVPCTEHGQCGSGACELAVGTCFPDDLVVHVDGDGGQDFMDVVDAVAAVAAGGYGVVVVHERDGADPYTGGVLIDGGKHIALLAAAGESPILQGTGSNPGLRVEGAGTILYMEGLGLVGNTMGLGLRVNGALAWVDRSRIVQNSGGGVLAEAGAQLVLRSCFVGGNGSGLAGSHGVDASSANVQILYSTIARNDEAAIDSIRCMASTVDVRNSIVVGRDANSIDCPGISVVSSALDEDIGGNTNVGAADATWFVGPPSDFHLTLAGAAVFADVAQWQTGDPPTDIDGDARPAVDGSPDYAGADVP